MPPSKTIRLMTSNLSISKRRSAVPGMTLPEVLVALVILSIGLAAVWASAAQCLKMARANRETIAATEALMQRVEYSRAAGWSTIVNASAIRDNILQTAAPGAASLEGVEEQITVTPYPAVSPAPVPIVVQRHADGTVQIVSEPATGLYLRSVLSVRADFQVSWRGSQNQRPRTRAASTVIAVQGLLR